MRSHETRKSVNKGLMMQVHGMLEEWPLPCMRKAQLNLKGISRNCR